MFRNTLFKVAFAYYYTDDFISLAVCGVRIF